MKDKKQLGCILIMDDKYTAHLDEAPANRGEVWYHICVDGDDNKPHIVASLEMHNDSAFITITKIEGYQIKNMHELLTFMYLVEREVLQRNLDLER